MQSILQFRISGNGPNQVLHASLRSGRATAESVADSLRKERPMVVAVDAPGRQPLKKFTPITAALRDLGYKVDVGVYNAQDFGAAVSEVSTILRATRVGELPDLPKPVAPGAWKWTASTHSISDYRNGRYFGVIPSRNVDVIPMPAELKAFLAEQGIRPELLDEEFLVVGRPRQVPRGDGFAARTGPSAGRPYSHGGVPEWPGRTAAAQDRASACMPSCLVRSVSGLRGLRTRPRAGDGIPSGARSPILMMRAESCRP